MTLTYSGYLNVFTVSSNNSVNKIYTQSLQSVIPNGIYCAEMDSNNLYLIMGSFASSYYSTKNSSNGLFLWRVLNAEPWLKNVPIQNETNKNKVVLLLLHK